MKPGGFAALLWIAAAAHALAWAVLLPLAQGPDEEEHFAYVQFLAEERRLPAYGRDFHVTEEWDRALRAAEFDRIRWESRERARPFAWPPADPEAARRPSARKTLSGAPAQAPLYYALVAPAYFALRDASVVARLYAVRALGALVFCATALLAWAAARAWSGADGEAERLCGLLVAAHPQAAFLAGIVNPDALCALLWTAFLVAAAPGAQASRAFGAGVLAGLTYLAKSFGASAVIAGAGLFGVRAFRARDVRAAAAFLLGAALPVAPWFAYALGRPGGLVGIETLGPTGAERFLDLFRVTSPWTLFSQAWGVFGWLDAPLPRGVRAGIALVCAAAIAGLVLRGRSTGLFRPAADWLGLAALHAAWVTVSVGAFYLRSGCLVGLQGRYFLLPVACWIGPLAAGLLAWSPPRPPSARRCVGRWIGVAAVLLALYALSVAFRRYYGPV